MNRITHELDFDDEYGYLSDDGGRELSKISFEYDGDFNIFEFKLMCIRLASSIGYASKNIEEAFGEKYEPLELESLRQAEMKDLLSGVNLHKSASEE